MAETNSQRIAKNTGYLFFRMLVVFAIGLYTSRLVLQYLGVEDFGVYNVVGSIVVFFNFFKVALNVSTSRYLSYEIGVGDQKKISQMFSMAINCHIIFATIVAIILEFLGIWFLNTQMNIPDDRLTAANWVLQFSIITFFFSLATNPYNSCIIAYEKMNFYAITSFFEAILKLSIVIGLAISPIDKLVTYAGMLTIVSIILGTCNIVYCYYMFKDCRYFRYWDTKIVKQFASYSGWSIIVNISDVCTTQSINVFLNLFIGVVANASMGIATQVIQHLYQFLTNFAQSFNPQIIKSYAAKNYDYFLQLVYSTSKISYFILFYISLPVILNIEFVLHLWLGEYPIYAPTFIKVIIIYYLIDSFQAPLWQAVHATGNIRTHQIIVSSIKIIAIPFSYLVLKLGYPGHYALMIWAGLNGMCAIARTIYLQKLINLDLRYYSIAIVGKIILISLLGLPIPYYVYQLCTSQWQCLVLSSLCAFTVNGIIIYFLGLDSKEKNLIHNLPIVKKLFRR